MAQAQIRNGKTIRKIGNIKGGNRKKRELDKGYGLHKGHHGSAGQLLGCGILQLYQANTRHCRRDEDSCEAAIKKVLRLLRKSGSCVHTGKHLPPNIRLQAPVVVVDTADNIQLNGKSGIIVYIDGTNTQFSA